MQLPEELPGPFFALLGILSLAAGCTPSEPPPQAAMTTEARLEAQPAPDFLFLNGKVLTVDKEFSIAEAVAVTGNKISAVGSSDDLARQAGQNTRVIDLDGKTMTPGIIDIHNHLIYNAAIWPNNARLSSARTRTEALEILQAKAQEIGPGDGPEHIVFGFGGWKPLPRKSILLSSRACRADRWFMLSRPKQSDSNIISPMSGKRMPSRSKSMHPFSQIS